MGTCYLHLSVLSSFLLLYRRWNTFLFPLFKPVLWIRTTDIPILIVFFFVSGLLDATKNIFPPRSVADPACLSRIPDPNCLHPGSRILIKEFKYFNPQKSKKMVSKLLKNMIRVVHPGSGCWLSPIPDPDADFLPSRIPDPGVKKHPIPDPDPQHCPQDFCSVRYSFKVHLHQPSMVKSPKEVRKQ